MDPQVSGSFIPKKPLVESRRRGAGVGFLLLISILLFVLSLVGAGGVLAYKGILNAQIASRDAQLKRAEGAFEPKVIEDLLRLDSRLEHTDKLLTRHVAPSGIFNFLSLVTLAQVQFTKFDYTLGTNGAASIVLTGTADSFSTVALQSDQLSSNRLLKNVVFSDVGVSQTGAVSFNVHADVDPSLFVYAKQTTATDALPTVPAAPAEDSVTQQP